VFGIEWCRASRDCRPSRGYSHPIDKHTTVHAAFDSTHMVVLPVRNASLCRLCCFWTRSLVVVWTRSVHREATFETGADPPRGDGPTPGDGCDCRKEGRRSGGVTEGAGDQKAAADNLRESNYNFMPQVGMTTLMPTSIDEHGHISGPSMSCSGSQLILPVSNHLHHNKTNPDFVD